MAVGAVAEAVLEPEDAMENPVQKLQAALANANPEVLQKIKQADHDFMLNMEKLEWTWEKSPRRTGRLKSWPLLIQ